MRIVGDHLAGIAANSSDLTESDLFGRSAFNRYYYAAFLNVRSVLKTIDNSWATPSHKSIPEVLGGEVLRRLKREIQKAQQTHLIRRGEGDHLYRTAAAAASDLANLLASARETRRVADYEPETRVAKNGSIMKLERWVLWKLLGIGRGEWTSKQRQYSASMTNSDSSELERLRIFLNERKCRFVAEIRESRSEGIDFGLFVPNDLVTDRADKTHTSRRQMTQLKNTIRDKLGISVEWIVTPGEQLAAIEAALAKLLQTRFPGVINGVFISAPKISPVWVWIDPVPGAKQLPDIPAITAVCVELLGVFGIKATSVAYSRSEELPSNSIILRCLKIHAPATTAQLVAKLHEQGVTVPNARWLHSKLDTMRRNGLLVWLSNETYALTELALNTVPHGTNRSSSDVQRALALGRRKW